jgi:hypothetical protein
MTLSGQMAQNAPKGDVDMLDREVRETVADDRPNPTPRRFRFIGSLLLPCLLGTMAPGAVVAQEWTYRVRPGDTVWDLSGKYVRSDVPWQRLQSYNRIADPYHLPPGSLMRFPVAWLKQQPAWARVLGVHGEAFAVDAGGRRSGVTEGMRLGIGTTIRTGENASLTLEFADGSRLLLEADSELKLDKLSAFGATGMADTRLRLSKGRASNQVRPLRGANSHYIIQTPDIMSSVRGTRFRIGSDGGTSKVEVTEGHVKVAGAGSQVMLNPDQGTISGPTGAPRAPVELLPRPSSVELDAAKRPIVLRWAAVPGAQRYRVQVGATRAFLYLLHDRVVADASDAIDDLPDGDYGIRVRAIDAQGIEGRDATIETHVSLSAPFTIEPVAGGAVNVDHPRFRWASMGPGVRYRFQLAGAAGFAQPLLDIPQLAGTELRTPQALPPGDYAWRIAAIDGEGRNSPYGDEIPFTVVPPAAGPLVTGDAGGTHGRELRVGWPAGTPGQKYRFQLSRNRDFSRLAVDRTTNQNQVALPGLGAGTWHARVQLIDSDGYAHPFGPGQSFKIACVPCRWAAGGALLLLLSL